MFFSEVQITRQLEVLFPHEYKDDEVVVLVSNRNHRLGCFYLKDKQLAFSQLVEKAREYNGTDLYIVTNPMSHDKLMDREAKKGGLPIGRLTDLACVSNIGFDFDTSDKDEKYATREAVLELFKSKASLIVNSKENGGLHPYLILSERYEGCVHSMGVFCQNMLGDFKEDLGGKEVDNCYGPSRLLRLAGTTRADGSNVSIETDNPAAELIPFVLPPMPPRPKSKSNCDSAAVEHYGKHYGTTDEFELLERYCADMLPTLDYEPVLGAWNEWKHATATSGRTLVPYEGKMSQLSANDSRFAGMGSVHGNCYDFKILVALCEYGGVIDSKSDNYAEVKRKALFESEQKYRQILSDASLGVIEDEPKSSKRIKPIPVSQLFASNPTMRPVVVDGILRRGETANIIAAAKVGKSHLAHGLAWSVVSGLPWLSHEVSQGRVLVIDNELHTETLSSRLSNIANGMFINPSDYEHSIDVISLRGQNVDIHSIEKHLDTIEPGTYTLTIIDALYRTLPSGTSENDNAQMMCIYNKLDHYAAQWDCAIAVVHHASKGQQGDKTITDVGAGAGSISRAADTHMVIRPHEEPDLSVLECVTRSFKSPEPVSIRFDWPLWLPVDGVLPNVKKSVQSRDEKSAKDDKEADQRLLDALVKAKNRLSESQLVRATGMGPTRISRAIGRVVSSGAIESKTVKRQGRRVAIYGLTATPNCYGQNDPS